MLHNFNVFCIFIIQYHVFLSFYIFLIHYYVFVIFCVVLIHKGDTLRGNTGVTVYYKRIDQSWNFADRN
jgi:hypothetical protein